MEKLLWVIVLVITSVAWADNPLTHILKAEDLRITGCQKLHKLTEHSDPKVAKAAIIALGRMNDTKAVEALKQVLRNASPELKSRAATALGLIATVDAVTALTAELTDKADKTVLVSALTALGNTGSKLPLSAIASILKTNSDLEVQEAGFHALGKLWGGKSADWELPEGMLNRALQATKANPSAAFALSRFKGKWETLDEKSLLAILEGNLPAETKGFVCRLLTKRVTPAAKKWILQQALDPNPSLAIECLKPLEKLPLDAETEIVLAKTLDSSNSPLRVQAMTTIASLKATKFTPILSKLIDNGASKWIKEESLKTLCTVSPDTCRTIVEKKLKDEHSSLFLASVESLSILGQPKDIEKLALLASSSNTKVQAKAWEGLAKISSDKLPLAVKDAAKKALEQEDIAILSAVSEGIGKWKFAEFKERLQTLLLSLDSNEYFEVKVTIRDASMELGVDSPELTAPITKTDFTLEEIDKVLKSEITLVTTKGEIKFRFFEETPLTALHVYRFAKSEKGKKPFYAEKIFHRVVPHFVVQGGDPRGDGYGGPGFLIRDEADSRKHTRGTLGIATAGKDTGGCQFFINTGPNLHLDGKYTNFGEVTKGMEVADKLEIGDKILSVSVSR